MRKIKVLNAERTSELLEYQKTIVKAEQSLVKISIKFALKRMQGEVQVFEREIELDYVKYKDKVIQLNFYNGTEMMELKAITLLEYVDRYSCITNLCNNIDNNKSVFSICRIVFDEDVYVSFVEDVQLDTELSDVELLDVHPQKTMTGNLVAHSSIFADKRSRFQVKAELIGQIDHYNSITYLECQVDALTRVVKALLASSNMLPPPELVDILNKADEFSVLDIKGQECILQEFDNKQQLRNLQQRYYDEKTNTN